MKKNLFKLSAIILIICSAQSAIAQTDGTLTMTYTQSNPGNAEVGPDNTAANIYAVWIEDNAGTFIKTKNRFALSEKDHLPTWLVKSGGTPPVGTAKGNCLQVACNITDAVTGATRTLNTTPVSYGAKTITWDGKNVSGATNGVTVTDGIYKVWIESSWIDSGNNNHQTLDSFSFTKGAVNDLQTPANTTYFSNITLNWVVNPLANTSFDSKPEISIYPNPSNGIINIDIVNEIKEIKIFNLLGLMVKSEKLNNSTTNSTKTIDMNAFQNGLYIINVSNDYGTKSYKVVLNK